MNSSREGAEGEKNVERLVLSATVIRPISNRQQGLSAIVNYKEEMAFVQAFD
jgi:hypothetical protein